MLNEAFNNPDQNLQTFLAETITELGLDVVSEHDQTHYPKEMSPSYAVVTNIHQQQPRVAGWNESRFIYPASTYKLYVLGEAIRQHLAGIINLDETVFVKPENMREKTHLVEGAEYSISEILRMMIQYSDNVASNEAIDLVTRESVTRLLHDLECYGSEVTRKFAPRERELPQYQNVPATLSCAKHMATFLYAIEKGLIGGGQGRALIKAYLAMDETDHRRFRGGLPASASLYSKTGNWSVFSGQVAIIEEGNLQFILCALTLLNEEVSRPKLAELAKRVYIWVKKHSQ